MATLPQNSPVMVDDVTVGSVSGIDAVQRPDGTFSAAVKLSLDRNVNLPANSTAKVAQTSLLGSQHIELAAPRPSRRWASWATAPTFPESTPAAIPTTEEVLSSLGVVVNKGNLGALQDITDETYAAVAGRAGSFAELIPRLAELTGSLDRQTSDIIAAADGLNRFAAILAQQQGQPGPRAGLAARGAEGAQRQPGQHRRRVHRAAKFATVASHILAQTKEDFAADFKDLYPVIKSFNDNADDFIIGLELLPTFPFQ